MSGTGSGTGEHGRRMSDSTTSQTGWVGWVLFAAIMMMVVGCYQVIVGLAALFKDEYYLVGSRGLVVNVDYTTWGWTHLIIGVVIALAGLGLMVGQTWARVVGILVACLSAVVNMVFLPAYPLWSILIITLDVLVIYALAVHGRELRND